MAIRKCPYCKAFIEEGAEFCSNCGTQLLFPEDENIEDEIPGEKIIVDDSDEDDEEEIVLLEEDKDADPLAGDLLDSAEEEEPLHEVELEEAEPVEINTDEPVELQDVEGEQESGEDLLEEKNVPDEILPEEQGISKDELEEEIDLEEEWSEEKIHEEKSAEINLEGIDEEEVIKEIGKETPSDSNEEGLKMEDLEKKVESTEIEKQEIDRFIDSIRKDQGADVASDPLPKDPIDDFSHKVDEPIKENESDFMPHDEESNNFEEPFQEEPVYEEPVLEQAMEEKIEEELQEENIDEDPPPHSSTSPPFEKRNIAPPTDELPAWASKIDEEPPSNIPMTEEEKEFVPPEKLPPQDTGMGLPEVVAQEKLPFSGETIKAKEKTTKESPFPFSAWIKSRIFDVLFIGVIWFITTWIASNVMEVKLFKLISSAALLLTLFYVVLLSAYLFLFFFFLGETLGDYLLSPKHRSELHRPT